MAPGREPLTADGINSGYSESLGTIVTEKADQARMRLEGVIEKLRTEQEIKEESGDGTR